MVWGIIINGPVDFINITSRPYTRSILCDLFLEGCTGSIATVLPPESFLNLDLTSDRFWDKDWCEWRPSSDRLFREWDSFSVLWSVLLRLSFLSRDFFLTSVDFFLSLAWLSVSLSSFLLCPVWSEVVLGTIFLCATGWLFWWSNNSWSKTSAASGFMIIISSDTDSSEKKIYIDIRGW